MSKALEQRSCSCRCHQFQIGRKQVGSTIPLRASGPCQEARCRQRMKRGSPATVTCSDSPFIRGFCPFVVHRSDCERSQRYPFYSGKTSSGRQVNWSDGKAPLAPTPPGANDETVVDTDYCLRSQKQYSSSRLRLIDTMEDVFVSSLTSLNYSQCPRRPGSLLLRRHRHPRPLAGST